MSVWKRALRARVKPLVYRLRSRYLYRVANFYVNAVDNDNDSEFSTNGEARFARERLRGCAIAFDVGAATGAWTEIALAADPNVIVHCFEPSRRFAMLCERNFGTRVVLNKLGLGHEPSRGELFYDASGGSNSLFPQRFAGESYGDTEHETIAISSIDKYCGDHDIAFVDFIKMDIEGYEMAALRGAEQMLRAGKIGVIQFEYSAVFLDAGSSLMRLMPYVKGVNPAYEFHKIYPDGTRLIRAYHHALDNFKTQNWAIIKRR